MTDRRGTLWAAILGSGIVFLDSSVLTVALPRIARDLPAHVVGTLEGESYVYNGYLLGESAFLILAGWLTDVHGRRRIFTLGLAAFGPSSLLSGFAPSLEWLIVLRVLQGTSGALIVPGSLALVTASFSGEEQGRAFGVWSGASAGVAVLGPHAECASDRKSTRLNSSHGYISYAVFCLKKKTNLAYPMNTVHWFALSPS